MWRSTDGVVENYLSNESTIRSQALITAEWNLNIIENLQEVGNYRFRPDDDTQIVAVDNDNKVTEIIQDGSPYSFPRFSIGDTVPLDYVPGRVDPISSFVQETATTEEPLYYGATDSSTAVDFSVDDAGNPVIFAPTKKKIKSLFSLQDCLGRFRPRSGINKVMYFDGKYLNRVHPDMARQPRFYFPTPTDRFKYWTSYRTEGLGLEISASVTKIYPTEVVNEQNVTRLRAIANDFTNGDTITFHATDSNGNPVTIDGITGESFLVKSASSNYIKIYADLNDTGSPVSYSNLYITGTTLQTLSQGISFQSGDTYPINDAVPFVVYKNPVPANRLVVKMQTKVGDIDLGPYQTIDGDSYEDPFYDTPTNKAVPSNWKIQVLNDSDMWVDAYDFTQNPYDIPSHGHIELSYGLIVPSSTEHIESLKPIFLNAGSLGSSVALPAAAPAGYAYLVKDDNGPGTFYVAFEDISGKFLGYDSFPAVYGWYLSESEVPLNTTSFVSDFTDPEYYTVDDVINYRDFKKIKGIRIVVKEMAIEGATFDLIEMSPRLAANLTNMVQEVSVTKHASDLGSSGMPVGQLLASTGSITIFDYDQSFNKYNENSIVKDLLTKNLQVKIYESIFPGNGTIYTIPVKTLYADGFPEISHENRTVQIKLRDLFFYFESMKAPEILIPNCSLSMAVSCLMDSIGFSNYTFKRPLDQSTEPVIPYFFVAPDTTVAQVLEDLAISTQTAMFLDEYNNLVLMSKEYMMPQDASTRATDFVFSGNDQDRLTEFPFTRQAGSLANIMQLQSIDDDVYNDGKISYETKYIQRSYSSLAQANYLDSEKTWVYKPVLLWEVSPEDNTKSWNDESAKQSSYTLAAIPLDTDLSDSVPTVVDGVIVDNTMDLGEAIYWLSRYNGYFYANGEIIKFDAVEYNIPLPDVVGVDGTILMESVTTKVGKNEVTVEVPTGEIDIVNKDIIPNIEVGKVIFETGGIFADGTIIQAVDDVNGTITVDPKNILMTSSLSITFDVRQVTNNVWISNVEEYQKYFAKLPFGGKIYPTGLVRIYAEPYYDADSATGLKEGDVAKHGRAQFGTTITSHKAGIDESWTNVEPTSADNHKIVEMKHSFLFNGGTVPTTYQNAPAGKLSATQTTIKKAAYRGVIKNFLSSKNTKETEANKTNTVNVGTVQSSALIIDGPTYPSGYNPLSYMQYVHKKMDPSFRHFETRLRIIGEMEDDRSKVQTPVGSNPYYTVDGKNVGGASGGIGIWVDPKTNNGYFLEIVALTDTTANAYTATASAINTVFFYKIQADASGHAIPIVLWSGIAPILCDDGRFAGQGMQSNQTNTTVYDLGIDYTKNKNESHTRFTMYLNGRVLGSVIDNDPLKNGQNVALFARGSARMMFENLFAIADSYEDKNGRSMDVDAPVASAFGFTNKNASNASRKYALSGSISNTILTSTSPSSTAKHNIYFEEFGTIMREMAYFNIKYDKAYPALYAKISPTFNNNQGYAISGFTANAFGAEFLIFNITDTVLSLDSGSGNYLRIQGVTFTQNSRHDLTVDEFFNDKGNLSDPQYRDGQAYNQKYAQEYSDIRKNRLTYGNKSFTINAPYLQSQDAANDLMSWLTGKIMKSRKAVGMEVLSMPHLQLGDIVEINYTKNGISQLSGESSGRYVIYSIEYSRSNEGPSMVIHLSEVR